MVKDELGRNMTPSPDDLLEALGPLAQAFYAQQLVMQLAANYVVMIAADDGTVTDTDPPAVALQMFLQGAGMLTSACVLLGILDPAADEAPS